MQKDLDFIAGTFFDQEIPKKRRYLLKYFKTDIQRAYLRYYLTFGDHCNFVDHTGVWCSPRMLAHLRTKYHRLIDEYDQAKVSLTEEGMEIVLLIESGKYVLTKKGKS